MFDRRAVVVLYKRLMRYAEQLKLSDQDYVKRYIRQAFEANKTLANPEAVQFFYDVSFEDVVG